MAKPQIVKCRYCKKEIEKSIAYKPISDSRVYYCDKECYELSQTKKNTKQNNGRYKSTKGSEREILTDYIQSLYLKVGYTKQNINWAMIGSQIKGFVDNDRYKYSGIKYTLWYMQTIKGMNLFKDGFNGSILNLIPYYYLEAKEYAIKRRDIKLAVNEFEFDNGVNLIDRDKELRLDKINLEEIE